MGVLLEAFVGRLRCEAAVGAMLVLVVLPFLELGVEDVCVVDGDAVQQPVELLGVDAMGSLHLAVEAGCSGLDVDVVDATVEHVPVEAALEL